ncbi:MAG TPA: DUF4446 family protein [Candidatus Wirthbacteria bacterium]|nr:DUF4446 family protein [Candidatus Wirthbacteria bacterium]
MESLLNFIINYGSQLFVLLGIIYVSYFFYRVDRRLKSIQKLSDFLSTEIKGASLEAILNELANKFEQLSFNINQLGGLQQQNRELTRHCIQKTALLRFNPFEDMGGDQSFAVALMDDFDNGLILSSLHARDGTRIYAKSIRAGRSEHPLANEEKIVLKQAMQTKA